MFNWSSITRSKIPLSSTTSSLKNIFVAICQPGKLKTSNFVFVASSMISTSTENAKESNLSRLGDRDHLKVTATQRRDPDIHDVYISQISDISPTVKQLYLCTDHRPVPFTFKPGQWVDLFLPGVDKVGGFSMTSSSTELAETGRLRLAVKYSENPPALWVHTKSKEGEKVSIRVGGDFFLHLDALPDDKRTNILFIAGGVGINPLASMVAQIREYYKKFGLEQTKLGKTVLMFSAKTSEELLFKDEFNAAEREIPDLHFRYFVTGSDVKDPNSSDTVKRCRIGQPEIEEALSQIMKVTIPLSKDAQLLTYLCGPSAMITSTEHILKSLGLKSIFYENWWQ